jgi:hypothetical protein
VFSEPVVNVRSSCVSDCIITYPAKAPLQSRAAKACAPREPLKAGRRGGYSALQ